MNEQLRPPKMPLSTQAAEGLPRRRWTTAELEAMVRAHILDENERIELIGGEVVPMPPKGNRHELVKDELQQFWIPRATADIKISTECQFNLDAETYTVPDLLVRPAAIKAPYVRGTTALLVVEIADSSLDYDRKAKAQVYASFGVSEYWVVNAWTLQTRVHRQPAASGFTDVQDFGQSDQLTPLLAPSLALRLATLDLG